MFELVINGAVVRTGPERAVRRRAAEEIRTLLALYSRPEAHAAILRAANDIEHGSMTRFFNGRARLNLRICPAGTHAAVTA